jgi:hypothetical protein
VPEQWRTAFPQGVEVGGLVVPRSGLPASVQDPDPLERQCPDGSLMRTAFRSLLPIVSAGPERFVDGLGCPFDERLAQEFRALPAPVRPTLLAATFGRGGDASVLLQFISPVEAVALLAKGREQARRLWGPAPGRQSNRAKSGCARATAAISLSNTSIAESTVRSCATNASTCNRQAVMMPGSSVRGVAARIDSRRAAISLIRHLWAWKNASRVVSWARLTVKSVGQRVRKSQKSTVSLCSNHSRACG